MSNSTSAAAGSLFFACIILYYSGMELRFPSGGVFRVRVGDITECKVDAIVNAANSGLRGGGGVDGAIHRAGGPSLMKELDRIRALQGGCPAGSAVVTGPGNLKAKFVFHAVGPVYHTGKNREPELLRSCYITCFQLAEERGLQSIAFPCISTGAYGYPSEEAASIAIDAIAHYLGLPGSQRREVEVVAFDTAMYEIYARLLKTRPELLE